MRMICILFVLMANGLLAQTTATDFEADVAALAFQEELSATYKNPDSTILSKEQLKDFKGLEFYPIDAKFRVSATFERTPTAQAFEMMLSSGRTREYVSYGIANFQIDGKEYSLPIYQNTEYIRNPSHEYGNSLFLPFTDYTSGDGSYGGGRYIDLYLNDIENGRVVIDFNKAYNPYCAYATGYNCPIPPEANDLKVRIEAGVKDFGKH